MPERTARAPLLPEDRECVATHVDPAIDEGGNDGKWHKWLARPSVRANARGALARASQRGCIPSR